MLHFETYQGLRVVYDNRDVPNYRQQLLTLLTARSRGKASWVPTNGGRLPLIPPSQQRKRMQVFCRKAGGKDPLGDVVFIANVDNNHTEELAVMATWTQAEVHNRSYFREPEKKIAILQCGDTLLVVKTGKILSLSGKIRGTVEKQPELAMPSRTEPRLL